MKNNLLIIGASGHGKVVADIALKMNKWNCIAFLDDDENIKYSIGFEVLGKSHEATNYIDDFDIFVAIGNNETRRKVHERLEVEGARIPTLIHPRVVVGEEVNIGHGTVIMAGVVINCCTEIGKGCIINTSTSVDHDNVIQDFVHLSPGVHTGGSVIIGQSSWLGIGSNVSNNINIVNNCIVGAGAVIVNDITETGTYVGVPARRV